MTASAAMPKYRCHKEVWALKIAQVETIPGGGCILHPMEFKHYAPITLPAYFVSKHDPKPGGYYVQYADGYTSYSPAQAFEEGYTRI